MLQKLQNYQLNSVENLPMRTVMNTILGEKHYSHVIFKNRVNSSKCHSELLWEHWWRVFRLQTVFLEPFDDIYQWFCTRFGIP